MVGVAGTARHRRTRTRPDWLKLHAAPAATGISAREPSVTGTVTTILGWGAIWWAPMLVILLTLGQHHVLWDIGIFFSKLAVVTFGGAYAVLAYMAQQAVGLDGLGQRQEKWPMGSGLPRRRRAR